MIPDARADYRFYDNPLVTGVPHIRFYAGCPLKASNGHTLGTLCIIDTEPRTLDDVDLKMLKDLGEMIEHELHVIEMATQDDLTRLTNRRGFLLSAEQNMQLCLRHNLQMSLVFMDLDEFKRINDEHGHSVGDQALITFSDLLKKSSRASDVIARLSGDEFVVLLINASKHFALTFVNHLEECIDQFNTGDKEYKLMFSYGVVGFDRNKHHTIYDLLQEGDYSMYELKHSKKKLQAI